MNMMECKTAFASDARDTLIDVINPATGLSWCYSKTLEIVRAEYPDAQIVNIDDWYAAKGKRQDSPVTWTETTEETFDEMLDVLPPAFMGNGGFLVGEPTDHHAGNGQPRFQAFVKRNGKYLAASRPMTRAEFSEMKETI